MTKTESLNIEKVCDTGCPFCDPKARRNGDYDFTVPLDDEHSVYVAPDHGMLMPGHLLAVTEAHLTSFAQLEPERLKALDPELSQIESALAVEFGEYFRLEHGSDNINGHGSGACIDHAHIHLVPADEDVGRHLQGQLPWQELDSYEDLAEFRGAPYIYLGRLAAHYAVGDPRLPGQWVRRQIASVKGLDTWDWALMDSRDDRRVTFEKLEGVLIEPYD